MSGDSYTMIYVILAVITATLIPIVGYLAKTIVSGLTKNTQTTNELAYTVAAIQANQAQDHATIVRHEDTLDWLVRGKRP